MHSTQPQHLKPHSACLANARAEFAFGLLLLLLGCAIYLLFRSTTIRLYQWLSAIGMQGILASAREATQVLHLPEFVRFSLPDGLFCCAYMTTMDALWWKEPMLQRCIAISLLPLMAIGHELLQYAGWAKGTFDLSDLLCYTIPYIIFILYLFTHFKTKQT